MSQRDMNDVEPMAPDIQGNPAHLARGGFVGARGNIINQPSQHHGAEDEEEVDEESQAVKDAATSARIRSDVQGSRAARDTQTKAGTYDFRYRYGTNHGPELVNMSGGNINQFRDQVLHRPSPNDISLGFDLQTGSYSTPVDVETLRPREETRSAAAAPLMNKQHGQGPMRGHDNDRGYSQHTWSPHRRSLGRGRDFSSRRDDGRRSRSPRRDDDSRRRSPSPARLRHGSDNIYGGEALTNRQHASHHQHAGHVVERVQDIAQRASASAAQVRQHLDSIQNNLSAIQSQRESHDIIQGVTDALANHTKPHVSWDMTLTRLTKGVENVPIAPDSPVKVLDVMMAIGADIVRADRCARIAYAVATWDINPNTLKRWECFFSLAVDDKETDAGFTDAQCKPCVKYKRDCLFMSVVKSQLDTGPSRLVQFCWDPLPLG